MTDVMNATTDDVDKTVMTIHDRYADERGKETNTTYDHKKVLKIFFRWLKLDSRDKNEVGDPPETKGIRLKRIKDKIVREDLLDENNTLKKENGSLSVAKSFFGRHIHNIAATSGVRRLANGLTGAIYAVLFFH